MISVCMPTFNGEKYIKKQIESILSQMNDEDELIISDDSSTDKTISIIASLNDSRIKIFSHTPNTGLLKKKLGIYRIVAENYLNALNYAKGDYIFLADQDDLWSQDRVKKFKEILSNNILALCNYSVIDSNDNITNKSYYKTKIVSNSFFKNIVVSRFMCCCMAFRKELLPYILPFPRNLMSCDQWVGILGTMVGNVSFIAEPLHLYRRHEINASPTTEKSPNSFFFKIYFRLYIAVLSINRYIKVKLSKLHN